jgi:hypothetical protein
MLHIPANVVIVGNQAVQRLPHKGNAGVFPGIGAREVIGRMPRDHFRKVPREKGQGV